MDNDIYNIRAARLAPIVRVLGLVMVALGLALTGIFISFTGGQALEMAADDLMMEIKPMVAAAGILLAVLLVSGVVTALRFRRGWAAIFCAAPFLTTMTLLMGTGTTPLIRNAFLVMLATALVCWAAAVTYYLYDLYR